MRIAVVGASGYVGRRLVARLADDGHSVVAIGRRAEALPQGAHGVEPRVTELGEPSVVDALAGVEAAYYLVHSMAGGSGFAARDLELAHGFAAASAEARVGRLVYLGALGAGALSEHLASRQEVGAALGTTGIPVVELRAAVVIGSGSTSFEMLRYLTERLPFMVCPRWVSTTVQPIAEPDLLDLLEEGLRLPPGVHEVGGDEATTYRDMIQAYARVRGLRRRVIVNVPFLSPRLSAYWVDLVTPLDRRVTHALIDSLRTNVVLRSPSPTRSSSSLSVGAAIRTALDSQRDEVTATLLERGGGLRDGVYQRVDEVPVGSPGAEAVRKDLARGGGDLRWYGLARAWQLRRLLGRFAGEDMELHRPAKLERGARLDWWLVGAARPGALTLCTEQWVVGEAWLGYTVLDDGAPRLRQVAAFRPRGTAGLLYWAGLWPVHSCVFRIMARHRAGWQRRSFA